MTGFPAELTDRIIDFLHPDKNALAACSLVCKSWLPASRYHLFRELILTPTKARFLVELFESATAKDVIEQPLRKTSRGRNALLRIPPRIKALLKLPTAEKVQSSDAPVEVDRCSSSSSSLTRIVDYVRRVSCKVNSVEPEWLTDSVMRFIASLPLLSEFSASFAYSTHIPRLECLKNLKKLSVDSQSNTDVIPRVAVVVANSPELEHLVVSGRQHYLDGEMRQVQDLFADISPDSPPLKLQHLGITGILLSDDAIIIPHLRSLTSLEWVGTIGSSVSIWQILTSEGIQLSQLKTSSINDDLLDYLSLSQGMTSLCLVLVTGRDEEDSKRLARRFYKDVLPRHTDTLRILRIEAAYEGDWCFGKHNLISITNCTKLEELAICLFWPLVPGHIDGARFDYSDSAPVHLLLNNASQFHCLRSLEILTIRIRNYCSCGTCRVTLNQVYEGILKGLAVNRFEILDGDHGVAGLPGYELRVGDMRFFVPRTIRV